jgi:hypothetical protein
MALANTLAQDPPLTLEPGNTVKVLVFLMGSSQGVAIAFSSPSSGHHIRFVLKPAANGFDDDVCSVFAL